MINVVVTGTGPLLTLAEARLHLRIDGDDEDTLITAYADAAVQRCLSWCDLKLVPQGAEPAFKAAALLFLGDLYGAREISQAGSLTFSSTVEDLLRPHRIVRI